MADLAEQRGMRLVATLYLRKAVPVKIRERTLVHALVIRSAMGLTPAPDVVVRGLNFYYLVHKLKRRGLNRPVDKLIRAVALQKGLAKRGITLDELIAYREAAELLES